MTRQHEKSQRKIQKYVKWSEILEGILESWEKLDSADPSQLYLLFCEKQPANGKENAAIAWTFWQPHLSSEGINCCFMLSDPRNLIIPFSWLNWYQIKLLHILQYCFWICFLFLDKKSWPYWYEFGITPVKVRNTWNNILSNII